MLSVGFPDKANCGALVDANCNNHLGVVVPIPRVVDEVSNAEFDTAPNVEPFERNCSSEPVPAGLAPPLPPPTQVLEIA